MATIIPRWEWRTFGTRFGPAEAAFAALQETGFQESDELYLLTGGRNNVKVRDNLMDIKVLREVDAEGLERWEPIMKARFPLSAEQASEVAGALGIAAPPANDRTWTLDAFLETFAGPAGPIRPVAVHKSRVRYVVGGCTSEVSDVIADGHPVRTIAIESEDAAAVVAAVASVRLAGFRNISYPNGLAAAVAGRPDRYAVIDVGTHSVKFHLAEVSADGMWETLVDRAEVTRLGEGLAESGSISEAALERTITAIGAMATEARRVDALAIAAVGTAGLRLAANSDTVVAEIGRRTGVIVEVISGEEESRLAYQAAVAGLGLGAGSAVVFDTGGGSSQFTFGAGGNVQERFSVNVGAASYTERFGLDRAVGQARLEEALAAISADLGRLDGRQPPDRLVGMGGAITNITAVALGLSRYDPGKVQGFRLERTEVARQIAQYARMDAEARRSIVGLQPKRAEVILAGACIVRTVMERLSQSALTVSDRGLRHGVFAARFGSETSARSVS